MGEDSGNATTKCNTGSGLDRTTTTKLMEKTVIFG